MLAYIFLNTRTAKSAEFEFYMVATSSNRCMLYGLRLTSLYLRVFIILYVRVRHSLYTTLTTVHSLKTLNQ